MSDASAPTPAAVTAAARRNPVGAHVPVAARGLVATGLGYAERIAAEAVQVFTANPRGWATPAGDPAKDEAFRIACAERGIPAYVHAPYLINFGSADTVTVARSGESLRHSLRRASAIGALGVVVHTGSATGDGDRDRGLRQVREAVLPLLDELDALADRLGEGPGASPSAPGAPTAPWLLLEPTAGQGTSLCSRIEDLGPYLDALDRHPRVGVCLDTCHAFAAGHDLAAPGGTTAALDLLAATAGPGRLRLIHANDSADVCGARRDRHANIGAGHIGAAPFAELFGHPETEGVPLILETPDRSAEPGRGHGPDVATLTGLRAEAGSRS